MITKIEVNKLFGVFDHTINLNVNENVTLILGENGLGKTLILKLVRSFFKREFNAIFSYLFEKITFWFASGERVSLKKIFAENENFLLVEYFLDNKLADKEKILIYDTGTRLFKKGSVMEWENYNYELEMVIKRNLPKAYERISAGQWLDSNTGDIYSTSALVRKYHRYLPYRLVRKYENDIEYKPWLLNITDKNVVFIETQRLLTEEEKFKSSVEMYSNEIINIIKNTRVEAIDLASRLDRTYPTRLIKSIKESSNISPEKLNDELADLEKKRELLNSVGLIDIEEEYIPQISQPITGPLSHEENVLKDVLLAYVSDSKKKLAIYDSLAKKINLLINIINKRFLYKKMTIDKIKGFVFKSTINSNIIPLSGLSSGEQHELVLFYHLLFNTEPNSLILIDEPEISLHISWQKNFIIDLMEIIRINNLTVIIATHSPDIIGNYWDLTVQLTGIKEDQISLEKE